jgi:uncharacterized cysteine cluster protein YcgN (CxxCxxCC family)
VNGWEAVCNCCGLCCFEKSVDRRGRYFTTRTPCRHLDIVSRRCRVYHKRLDVGEGCVKLTPELVRAADWLPDECAYRALVGGDLKDTRRGKDPA